jgi:hypothetical protein
MIFPVTAHPHIPLRNQKNPVYDVEALLLLLLLLLQANVSSVPISIQVFQFFLSFMFSNKIVHFPFPPYPHHVPSTSRASIAHILQIIFKIPDFCGVGS